MAATFEGQEVLEAVVAGIPAMADHIEAMRNPTQGGHGFRRKADSIPMIADSR